MINTAYENYKKLCTLEGVNPIPEENKCWYDHYVELSKFYREED